MLFEVDRMLRQVLERFLEAEGIEGKGLKLRDRQPVEAQGVADLVLAREGRQAVREQRTGRGRQQEILSQLVPGITRIAKKILDDVQK